MFKKYIRPISFPLILFFIWRLIIILFQIFLQPHYKITPDSQTLYQRLYLSWVTYWDAGHYISIAQNGYNYPQQAFFPLWPLIIKSLIILGVPVYIATYALTFIFGLSTFILFYMLVKKLLGKDKANLALLIFASFPSTMFLLAGYTETVFMTLALSSFIFFENKKYLLAALFGGLTSMTRLVGIGVGISRLTLSQPLNKKFLYFLISLSGLSIYMLYLQISYGDALLFSKATTEWCMVSNKCQFTFPLTPLSSYANLLLMGWTKPSLSFVFIDWFFSVIFIGLSVFVFTRLKLTYFIYTSIIVLLPLLLGSTVGMVRYVLVAFPVFFIMPIILRSKFLFFIVCLLLFLLELRFVALFSSRIWVA